MDIKDWIGLIVAIILIIGIPIGVFFAADNFEYKSYCKECNIHYSEEEYAYCPRCGNGMKVVWGYATE